MSLAYLSSSVETLRQPDYTQTVKMPTALNVGHLVSAQIHMKMGDWARISAGRGIDLESVLDRKEYMYSVIALPVIQ